MTLSTKPAALFVAFFTLVFNVPSFAQDLDNPGTYMTAMSDAQTEMDQTYMAYMSAVAHSTRPKKIEKMRQKAVESIINAKYKITDLPIYKKDNSLRQSSIEYVQLCYNVFNEDYAKIVDMGEIAEQSFDEMQAMLLLEEKTNEKVHEASAKLQQAEKDFAAKYHVTLIDTKSEFGEKMSTATKLNHYHTQVYLVFFKCNWQDAQITEAINKKNLTNIEQSRNALISYAKEGMIALDSLKSFEGDPSLANVCRQALTNYKKMAESDLPKMIDFYLKEDNFSKMKKAFDLKDQSSLTKEEIDAYNKAVKDMNALVNSYNQANNSINNARTNLVNNWNETEKNFLDAHMPYYKKKK